MFWCTFFRWTWACIQIFHPSHPLCSPVIPTNTIQHDTWALCFETNVEHNHDDPSLFVHQNLMQNISDIILEEKSKWPEKKEKIDWHRDSTLFDIISKMSHLQPLPRVPLLLTDPHHFVCYHLVRAQILMPVTGWIGWEKLITASHFIEKLRLFYQSFCTRPARVHRLGCRSFQMFSLHTLLREEKEAHFDGKNGACFACLARWNYIGNRIRDPLIGFNFDWKQDYIGRSF